MGGQRHYHLSDGRMGQQPGEAVLQNGLAGQLQILFRAIGPHPAANPGGGNDGGQPGVAISHRRAHRPAQSPGHYPWE
ncbi:hypothetical protein D3C76_1741670 [compost metagenome]